MSVIRSFRVRLLVASLLWTLGLLAITHAVSLFVMHHVSPLILHFTPLTIGVAVAMMVAGVYQVRSGLSRFSQLRAELGEVRDGQATRVVGTYPTEVQPLVNDLNALLEHRDEAVRRALAKAGDLAHGLKTPLAVLAREAEVAAAAGHAELAATMSQQVERMRRQVDYHLAQARAAGSAMTAGTRCRVHDSVSGLVRTLAHLHADRGLSIDVAVSDEALFRGQREDLDEMLGNLLDNACKWAHSRIVITSSNRGETIELLVDDDGPGIDAAMRTEVLRRGVRADEALPGSGLGLSIVRELSELYRGSIELDESPSGGLRAKLVLPR